MRFTRIRVENWTNFKRFELPLQQRMFVVGPNASGKSNLLDVFRFLRDISERGLQQSVSGGERQGFSALRSLHARAYSAITIDVEMEMDGTAWRYALSVNQDKRRRVYVKSETVWKGKLTGAPYYVRAPDLDENDVIARGQTHLEQATASKSFRPIVQLFRQIRYLHVVPQLVREPDRAVAFRGHPFGADLLDQLATMKRAYPKAFQSRLRTINTALQIAVPQFEKMELEPDDRGHPHLRVLYKHWRPKAGWQSERQFSDGTLRLFGLLWSLLDGTGPILMEEPELSLHGALVREIPRLLWRLSSKTGRQVIVSTHSNDMLNGRGIDSDEVVILTPTVDGTQAALVSSFRDVRVLLENGSSMADAVMPRTAPPGAMQLTLPFVAAPET